MGNPWQHILNWKLKNDCCKQIGLEKNWKKKWLPQDFCEWFFSNCFSNILDNKFHSWFPQALWQTKYRYLLPLNYYQLMWGQHARVFITPISFCQVIDYFFSSENKMKTGFQKKPRMHLQFKFLEIKLSTNNDCTQLSDEPYKKRLVECL